MSPITTLASYFASLPDPRIRRSRRHDLFDILFIALCATLCGAESFAEIAQWGRSNQEWLKEWIPLTGGVPSHDTFGRVFARLDPQEFATCFAAWTKALHQRTDGEIISLDGKWLRGSFDKATGSEAIKMVSAWLHSPGTATVVGQAVRAWFWRRNVSQRAVTRRRRCHSCSSC